MRYSFNTHLLHFNVESKALDSSLKCNFDGRKEVSCGKISLQDLTSQRSAYGIHAAHPGTKIPDICVVENVTYSNRDRPHSGSAQIDDQPRTETQPWPTRVSASTSASKSAGASSPERSTDRRARLATGGSEAEVGLESGADLSLVEAV